MKILVLATLVVSVIGGPIVETWTMDELEKVLQTEPVDPEQKPYWSEAFNTIMYSLFTNKYLVKFLFEVILKYTGFIGS